MALSWVSVDARTGAINSYLTDLVPQGPCAVTIGRYETLGFTLPVPQDVINYYGAPLDTASQAVLGQLQDWNASIRPGSAVLIALDELDQPIWGGLVLSTTTDLGSTVTINTATLEAYLDRRYVGPYQVVGRRQDLIYSDLIGQFIVDGVLPGLPIRVANTASALSVSQTIYSYDDKTVYAAMQAMSNIRGGLQWTVGWEWSTSTKITPVLYCADRLGTAANAGMSPNAVFSAPGCVSDAKLVRDFSAGKGANRVTATGPGQGLTRLTDVETASTYSGRPLYEHRYAVAQSLLDSSTLQQHALRVLGALQNGTTSLTLTAAIADAPVLGVDWHLGDDIGYDLFAPAWADGSMLGGVGIVGGWQRDDFTVSPILLGQNLALL